MIVFITQNSNVVPLSQVWRFIDIAQIHVYTIRGKVCGPQYGIIFWVLSDQIESHRTPWKQGRKGPNVVRYCLLHWFVLRHQSQFFENATIVARQLKYLKGFCHFFWLRNPSQKKVFNYFPIWLFVSVITIYSLRHTIRRTRIRVYANKVICIHTTYAYN